MYISLQVDGTLIIPINNKRAKHWTLVVLRPSEKKVMFLDSMQRSGEHKTVLSAAKELVNAVIDAEGGCFRDWEWEDVQGLPQQPNKFDCGVYVIMFAWCISLGQQIVVPRDTVGLRRMLCVLLAERSRML
jgi:Ulp1 family protease